MLLGLDPWTYLDAEDPTEVMVWEVMFTKAQELAEIRDRNLAVHIANSVGQLFKKK